MCIFARYGPYKEELKQKAVDLGLVNQIILTDYLTDEEFQGLFALAHIYLQAPKSDGVSLTLMMAMVNKLAILTTNVGDVGENIHDGITGIIVQPTIDDIKKKTIYLINNPEMCKALGAKSYEWALKNCNRKENFKLFYEKIKNLEKKAGLDQNELEK